MNAAHAHPHPAAVDLTEFGIVTVDTGFERPVFDAAYLIVEGGRAAFIDCGVNASVPRLLKALADQGLTPDCVDYVIPTHVHLDHAGGAGLLMQECPNARLVAHPRGAPHLMDPTALVAGASAVYGAAAVQDTYGHIRPVPEERVQASSDGLVIELAGRPLRFIDSPGHARHHHCIWDARSQCWFTGDTFGISYPELDTPGGRFLFPTTTPVQFEPQALHASVDRMLETGPRAVCLTHYGALSRVPDLAALMHRQIDAMVAAVERRAGAPDRHEALKADLLDLYHGEYSALGGHLSRPELAALMAVDLELNAQGLCIWQDRRATARP